MPQLVPYPDEEVDWSDSTIPEKPPSPAKSKVAAKAQPSPRAAAAEPPPPTTTAQSGIAVAGVPNSQTDNAAGVYLKHMERLITERDEANKKRDEAVNEALRLRQLLEAERSATVAAQADCQSLRVVNSQQVQVAHALRAEVARLQAQVERSQLGGRGWVEGSEEGGLPY
jgi:hypothetical protein